MNETHKKNLENTRISSEVDMITPIDFIRICLKL